MVLLRRIELVVVLVLALFCAGVWSIVYAETPRSSGVLTFAVLNVGQGDALYIESPTGIQVLVDGGPGNAVLAALPQVMPALDRSLDMLVATHPDADHIGGFVDLLERYEVGAFLTPNIPKSTATAKRLEEAVSDKHIPRLVARRGMSIELGGGARLDVLYPDKDVSSLSEDEVNEGGIVSRLVYGDTEVLLMADVGLGVESRLLSLGATGLQSDLLKVGHHGSRFSTGTAFIKAVSPDVALISVGKDNTYGHPTEQALGVLRNATAKIFRTDENGTIRCVSDGAVFSCAGD